MSQPDPTDQPTPPADEPKAESRTESPAQAPVESPSLKEQIEAVRAERDANRDKWLRAEAELDNSRKRAQREADEARKYQSLPLARDILPGLDNLQRAILAASKSQNIEELAKGVSMVAKQFEDVLAAHGIQRIPAVGQPFDPNRHEAVHQVPSAEHPPMTIVDEFEPGYMLHDRVLRPSKVVVSSSPPPESEARGA